MIKNNTSQVSTTNKTKNLNYISKLSLAVALATTIESCSNHGATLGMKRQFGSEDTLEVERREMERERRERERRQNELIAQVQAAIPEPVPAAQIREDLELLSDAYQQQCSIM